MEAVDFRVGKRVYPIGVERRSNRRIYFNTPFSLKDIIIPEMKDNFDGMKWHGRDNNNQGEKLWSIPETQSNVFRFLYLTGKGDPYAWYNRPLVLLPPTPGAFTHQTMITSTIVQYRQVLIASEMGTGKTRAMFDALKHVGCPSVWWVAPKSALYSLMLEQDKWNYSGNIRFLTYQGLTKIIHNWKPGDEPPFALVCDESQKVKSDKAQMTQAAYHLSDSIRTTHGRNGIVVLLSGTVAPKSPVDLWSQARIVCPGFLREGSAQAFKRRMCLLEQATSPITGATYPKLVTWWNDSTKCKTCGQIKGHEHHNEAYIFPNGPYHKYEPSINEVELLSKRLKGLMTVVLKRDVLKELPEKTYRTIVCPPSNSTLRQAKMVLQMNSSGPAALNVLRQLSDGFQYDQEQCGVETCPACEGVGTLQDMEYVGPEYDEFDLPNPDEHPEYFKPTSIECGLCMGTKEVPKFKQIANQVSTPKEQVLKDLLDEFEDDGRVIIWAGFHGSLDRCRDIVLEHGKKHNQNWEVIRADGRGWESSWTGVDGRPLKPTEMLRAFQDKANGKRIAYIGHPGAGGTGVTLTASPVAIYFSNDFNFENRAQSEDRGHRPGMDLNKGFTIIDIVHLPSDLYVIDNLKRKMKLQAVSIGDLHTAINTPTPPDRGYGIRVDTRTTVK